jgi:hypothetical protein
MNRSKELLERIEELENTLLKGFANIRKLMTKEEDLVDRINLLHGVSNSIKKNKPYEKIPANLKISQLGRLGEIAFQDYLHEILSDGAVIKWMNQGYESSKPYDFIVTIGNETYFIDVKTTRGEFESDLYLTKHELKFALEHPETYYIARLSQYENSNGNYKAGSFNVKILTFKEAIDLLKSNI